MKTITYKGFQASVEFDDDALFVKVLHIDDILIAQCDRASDAKMTAHELIDDYLEDCREEGREPATSFKGSFNVRVSPEAHKRAAMAAAEVGITLNAWVSTAIQEKLECSKLSDRIDGVISNTKREMNSHFNDIIAIWQQQKLMKISPAQEIPNISRLDRMPSSINLQNTWINQEKRGNKYHA